MIKLKHFPVYPEAFLRQKSTSVQSAKEAEELKQKLMDNFPDSGAFAVCAIQIGIPKRATLIKFPSENRDPKAEPVFTFMCNPVIEKWDKPGLFAKEGCLSFPKKYKDTVRFNEVTVKYHSVLDGELDERKIVADSVDAVIIQHEVDHMEGVIFKDRARKIEPVRSDKIGRNIPCPCGSGLKYKKCCIGEDD